MQASRHLYVVTLCLNGWEHTRAFIYGMGQALSEIPNLAFRLILIDNGSTDETRKAISTLLAPDYNPEQGIIFVPNEGNVGVAAGWNQGIRIALANGAMGILVCGNDTLPMPGTMERLLALHSNGLPLVTGTAVPYDAPPQKIPPAVPEEPLLAAPDFSFFLLARIGIEALARHEFSDSQGMRTWPWCGGLFDERFGPAYFEDNDYHHRLTQAGLVAVRDPGALFRHDCSLTIRINPDIQRQNDQTFRLNGERFKEKWGALPHELPTPPQARPLNVTDEQWAIMTGGRAVEQLPRDQVVQQALRIYRHYKLLDE